MKKIFLNAFKSLLIVSLFFTGCQKQINDPVETTDQQNEAQNGKNDDKHGNKCRLVTLDWSEGGVGLWNYAYNNEGLADKWSIDYGDGVISEKIYYNKDDQIIKADEDYFGSPYVYRFFYNRKQLTRLTRTSLDFPDEIMDVKYIYNKKGQNIRQDDIGNDEHVLMFYDAMGNCTRTDIYLGTDLWFSDSYTFNAPVKNPWLHVPGIEYGFLSYGGSFTQNKRWFTSNTSVLYDADGTSLVINDYDPSQTVINTGTRNLPIAATYYDRVTESTVTITLDYENCGTGHDNDDLRSNRRTTKTSPPDNIKYQVNRIFRLTANDRKEQIAVLRKQIRNKIR